ncbi:MAG: acetoacetyl-CoA reductase [Granulosicoccus sp.]|nr:acetoacetyl-CoA reductase [Granulosicoccus sp.]
MSQRLALVTGATGGIGREICLHLANAGDRVIALDLPSQETTAKNWSDELKQSTGHKIEVASADVADFDSCQTMAETVLQQFGTVTVLVNVAGITRDSTLVKMEQSMWDQVLRTNLDSMFNVTRHFIEPMIAEGFGRIVNIASINGRKGQYGQTNYSAAKAGVHGFTMSLAQETAAKGITVNTISPGYVSTPMVEAIREDIRQQIVEQIPVRRPAEPSEIARVVSFLADNDSGYITGANIDVNGGLWMH